MALSRERTDAMATFPAELQTVGDHTRLDVAAGGDFITKPLDDITPTATHLQMQALTQNIRFTTDGSQATATHGFQLAAGSLDLVQNPIPVSSLGVSVFEEAAGAIVQHQWVR